MSVLDDTFTFFTKKLPSGYVWAMEATLTGTNLSNLSAFVATAGKKVTYNPGIPDITANTIQFDATVQYQVNPSNPGPIQVNIYQNPAVPVGTGVSYSMKIVLPWTTVDCAANVDATSGVVYGSQRNEFVTLVLKAGTALAPPK